MSKPNQSHVNLLITTGRQVVVNGEVNFSVQEVDSVKELHVANAIYATILQKLQEQPLATLSPGEYKVTLTAVISDVAGSVVVPDDEVSEPQDQ